MNRSLTTYLRSLLLLSVVITVSACTAEMMESILTPPPETQTTGPGEASTAATPRISFFRASPPNIMSGEQVELQWSTQDANSVEISGVGVVPTSGSQILDPDAGPGMYTLTARSQSGVAVTQEIRISIISPQMAGDRPDVMQLPEPRVLPRDAGSALAVPQSPRTPERGGARPGDTPSGGRDEPTRAPRILYFRFKNPDGIEGSVTEVEWQTQDAASVQVTGIGSVQAQGSASVDFLAGDPPGVFTLTASNSQGISATSSIEVDMVTLSGSVDPGGLAGVNQRPARPAGAMVGSVTAGAASPAMDRCQRAAQDRIAWNYEGKTHWQPANLRKLCRGAESSTAPAQCFKTVMHGGVDWGGGKRWQWNNAIDLCQGSTVAARTVSCFKRRVANGVGWQQAIAACNG